MRPGAGEGQGGGRREGLVAALWKCYFCPLCTCSSEADMKPSVFWQSSALYSGGAQGHGAIRCQAHVPECFRTMILKTQMKTFNKEALCLAKK